MNVFFVDPDPVLAASMLCLQHRAKMLTESVQILCTSIHVLYPETAKQYSLWKPTHVKHPSVLWAVEYGQAQRWILRHALKLAALHDKKIPAAANAMLNSLTCILSNLPCGILLGDVPQCMPPEFQRPSDPVKAYQLYYADKARLWATHGKQHLKMRYRDATCVPLWLESELGANWDRFIHFTNDFNRKG